MKKSNAYMFRLHRATALNLTTLSDGSRVNDYHITLVCRVPVDVADRMTNSMLERGVLLRVPDNLEEECVDALYEERQKELARLQEECAELSSTLGYLKAEISKVGE